MTYSFSISKAGIRNNRIGGNRIGGDLKTTKSEGVDICQPKEPGEPMIEVLRIGHRPGRDKRITTHVGLVARAFGADKIYIPKASGKIKRTLKGVVRKFGNDFQVDTDAQPRSLLGGYSGLIVHLTMYGLPLPRGMERVRSEIREEGILIVVGAEKVPGYVYEKADINISVGNQPHSEIAALAIFLDRVTRGNWLNRDFKGRLRIIPSD